MNRRLLLMVTLIMLLAICLPALAVDGDGTGDGKDVPLMLLSSDPGSGSTGVPVDTSITLGFSKNVINMSVRDNNQGQFSLTANGQDVPISVIMADDQMQPEMKRIIVIEPQGSLAPGTTYTLTIGGGLTAKSGAVLGSDAYVTFTTAAAATVAEQPVESPVETPAETPAAEQPATEASSTEANPNASANDAANQANKTVPVDQAPPADQAANVPVSQPATPADATVADQAKDNSPATDKTVPSTSPEQPASTAGDAGPDNWLIIAGIAAAAAVLAAVAVKLRKK